MPTRLRPAHERFEAQAERVEQARRALLACLPVGRVNPAPVPVGLELVRDEVRAVLLDLDGWRVPEVAREWEAVRQGCHEALAHTDEAARVAATTGELEEMLDAVGEVVEPLDAWGEAERAWLALRVRVPRRAAPGPDVDAGRDRPRR